MLGSTLLRWKSKQLQWHWEHDLMLSTLTTRTRFSPCVHIWWNPPRPCFPLTICILTRPSCSTSSFSWQLQLIARFPAATWPGTQHSHLQSVACNKLVNKNWFLSQSYLPPTPPPDLTATVMRTDASSPSRFPVPTQVCAWQNNAVKPGDCFHFTRIKAGWDNFLHALSGCLCAGVHVRARVWFSVPIPRLLNI